MGASKTESLVGVPGESIGKMEVVHGDIWGHWTTHVGSSGQCPACTLMRQSSQSSPSNLVLLYFSYIPIINCFLLTLIYFSMDRQFLETIFLTLE